MLVRLNYHVSCNTGRKSNCVREVEKLKKNREERRARQADKIAQRREVCVLVYVYCATIEWCICLHRNMIPVILSGSF